MFSLVFGKPFKSAGCPAGALISEVISPIITRDWRAPATGARLATQVLTETIDAKGAFNILRDEYNNRAVRDDLKAME